MNKKTENKKTDELTQISVPTKKIYLEIDEVVNIEVILRPFKQKHFAQAITIINKYFDSFNSVRLNYLAKRKEILEKYPEEKDEGIRNQTLADFEAGFNEGIEIAKAILRDAGEGISEDIKTIIEMSVTKSTAIASSDGSTERSPVELDLDDLTWGECLVLLGSTVGLNMDFFAQNMSAMNLEEIGKEPKQKESAGGKLSVA